MKKIKCTLPNASTEISGLQFAPADDGVLSDAVGDDVAAKFAGIPGYEIIDVPDPAAVKKAAQAAAESAAKAEAEAAQAAAESAAKAEAEAAQAAAESAAKAEAEAAQAAAESAAKAEAKAAKAAAKAAQKSADDVTT